MGALITYINSERHETKTDEVCKWTQKGKLKYKGGKELEEMLNLKSEDKCPPVSFDPPSNEQRQQLLEIMEEVGNTETPMYKLYETKSTAAAIPEQEKLLPKWIETRVCKPTLPTLIDYVQIKPLNEKQRIFYERNIMVSPYNAYHVYSLTVNQALRLLYGIQKEKNGLQDQRRINISMPKQNSNKVFFRKP